MFLSDLSDNVALFRRKRYEEYLRENKPEVYTSLQNTRKELSDAINEQRVNPFSKKPVIAAVTKKKTKNTYRMLKEMGYQNTSKNNIRSGLRDLRRFEPLPNLRNTLPDLSKLHRRSFDVLASKHDARGIVNPVKDTFTATSGRKPITQTILPKAPKPNTKDTKKLLRTLGVAGVVGGGVLGAYGLKKYNDARNKDKRR